MLKKVKWSSSSPLLIKTGVVDILAIGVNFFPYPPFWAVDFFPCFSRVFADFSRVRGVGNGHCKAFMVWIAIILILKLRINMIYWCISLKCWLKFSFSLLFVNFQLIYRKNFGAPWWRGEFGQIIYPCVQSSLHWINKISSEFPPDRQVKIAPETLLDLYHQE